MLGLVSVLIFVLFFISFSLILMSRIIKLPCGSCETSGWWYKCTEGTGYGSRACEMRKNFFGRAQKLIIDSINKIKNAILNSPNLLKIQNAIINLKDSIANIATNLIDDIYTIVGNIRTVFENGAQLYSMVVNLKDKIMLEISNYVTDVIQKTTEYGQFVYNKITEKYQVISEYVKQKGQELINNIINNFKTMFGGIPEAIEKIVNFMKKMIDLVVTIVNPIINIVNDIINFIKEVNDKIIKFFMSVEIPFPEITITNMDIKPFEWIKTIDTKPTLYVGSPINRDVLQPLNTPIDIVNNIFTRMKEIKVTVPKINLNIVNRKPFEIFSSVFTTFNNIINKISEQVRTILSPLQEIVSLASQLVTLIIDPQKLIDMFNDMKNRVVEMANGVKSIIINTYTEIYDKGVEVYNRIVSSEIIKQTREIIIEIYEKGSVYLIELVNSIKEITILLNDRFSDIGNAINNVKNIWYEISQDLVSFYREFMDIASQYVNILYEEGKIILNDAKDIATGEAISIIPKNLLLYACTFTVIIICTVSMLFMTNTLLII